MDDLVPDRFHAGDFRLVVATAGVGENPAGYHAVCLVLHAVSGILLWRLLARLKIPGAWLAAVLFVVHPVCVNSVARISELKNTLSLPFFLLAFLGYLHYEAAALYPEISNPPETHPSHRRATLWYVFSLIAFVLSLLSKTTVVMLPVLLLACAAWQRRADHVARCGAYRCRFLFCRWHSA